MRYLKQRTSKLIRLLLAAFFVLSFIPGCASVATKPENDTVSLPAEDSFEPLTDEQKQKLDEAWVEAGGGHLRWTEHYTRYLGTINGCTVVLIAEAIPNICVTSQQTVADYTFSWCAPFEIRVLKDGSLCTLTKAYDTGLLTKDHIAILKEHFERTVTITEN